MVEVRMTKLQSREWDRLLAGEPADLQPLERAGLVELRTRITLRSGVLRGQEEAVLTPAGRAALTEQGGQTDG